MANVTATMSEGTKVEVYARQFSFIGDEPIRAGGSDAGPEPYEFLLASLATCIAITLRLYSNHKGIPLDRVDIELEFARLRPDGDQGPAEWVDHIESHVTLHGTFDDAQRKRLTQVAERCPVHKTLANGIRIGDRVEFRDSSTRSP